jgi:hypothetical protein
MLPDYMQHSNNKKEEMLHIQEVLAPYEQLLGIILDEVELLFYRYHAYYFPILKDRTDQALCCLTYFIK